MFLSRTGHEKPCLKLGRPLSKAKYYKATDSEEYREGKVKRTPGGEWNRTETVDLQAVKAMIYSWWWRAFCIMNLRVIMSSKVKA